MLLILVGLSSYCQGKHQFHIELTPGVTLPIGKFSDKTFSSSPTGTKPSGLAKGGFSGSVSILYAIEQQYGVLITTGMHLNKQDPESYRAWLRSQGNNSANVTTNSWKTFKAMGGGWLSTKSGNNSKATFRLSLAIGICKTAVPAYSYIVFDQNGNPLSSFNQQKQSLPVSLCYQAGPDINYHLNSRVSVLLGSYFFNSNPKQQYQYYPNFPNTNTLVSAERKYSLASVEFHTGISVAL